MLPVPEDLINRLGPELLSVRLIAPFISVYSVYGWFHSGYAF